MTLFEKETNVTPQEKKAWTWLFLAWMIALASTLGALFIGEVLGQAPCQLCWYQRIAMFPLAIILGISCFANDFKIWRYALPLSLIGTLVALWHSLLYAGVISEAIQPCSKGGPSCTSSDMTLMGIIPLPYVSFVAFVAISILLLLTRRKEQ
ncbi:disulfide bond formation protein B [Magnetovibrio sp. PR-2]|uniref:disulfide bond formation protein B n=1 Tax=Magnetovibrio sp. PR-2 TaxID=3120356 RepID=UPI002FCE3CA5